MDQQLPVIELDPSRNLVPNDRQASWLHSTKRVP